MQKPELYIPFIRPLNHLEIPYMITGSMAAIMYGEPRLTHDIYMVIDLQPRWVELFYKAYNKSEFYVPPLEVLHIEAARDLKGHFNLLNQNTGFKADIYLKGDDELHHWAFRKRNQKVIGKDEIWIAPPEYVIVRKLLYHKEGKSPKHIRDIKSMLHHSGSKIGIKEIEQKVKAYNLAQSWKLVLDS